MLIKNLNIWRFFMGNIILNKLDTNYPFENILESHTSIIIQEGFKKLWSL